MTRRCIEPPPLLFLIIIFSCTQAHPAERPNIVLFLVDDMGWQDTSVPFWERPTPFNRHYLTPGMERLARQGVRFTHAYSHAVCSPTRTSIMTGENAARHGVTNWTLRPEGETSGTTQRLEAPRDWRRRGLQPRPDTLPALLGKAGYRTIHAGKAHWGAMDTPGSDPGNLGFDINIAGHAAGGPGHYHGQKHFGNKEKGGHTRPWGVPGLEAYHGTDTHLTDATTIEALRAVDDAVKAGRPFYLYLAHYAVHAPIQEHRPFVDHYRGKKYVGTDIAIPEPEARYASMVEGMDASLVSVLDKLEELRVDRETIVVFTSDNGGLSAHARGKTPRGTGTDTHCWPLREGKGSAYEGGTRVPFIVSWARPDRANELQARLPIRAGSISSGQVICEDLYPTLLAWAGLADEGKGPRVDGRDITGFVTGKLGFRIERPLVFHYPHRWGPGDDRSGYRPHSAIRLGDWKAIYFYQRREWELYHLKEDIGERRNLAAERTEIFEKLANRLLGELTERGAQWPVHRKTKQDEPLLLPRDLPDGADG